MYLILNLFWILLNARITLEIVLLGLIIAAAVFAFACRFMDYSIRKEILLYRSAGYLAAYLLLLFKEIVSANLQVLRFVYSPKYVPEPGVVYFRTGLQSGLTKVLLANSITLTPGTVTVSVEDGVFCVTCLDMQMGEEIQHCAFVQALLKMEEAWAGMKLKKEFKE